MTKFRRVNDFKTHFVVNFSKFREIFLPKLNFSRFRIFAFFDFRVYDPKSPNRLGLTISKCEFLQNRQKLIKSKMFRGEKSFFGVSNKFPKSDFWKIFGNLREQTHRHHRNLAFWGHFIRARWQFLRQNVILYRKNDAKKHSSNWDDVRPNARARALAPDQTHAATRRQGATPTIFFRVGISDFWWILVNFQLFLRNFIDKSNENFEN